MWISQEWRDRIIWGTILGLLTVILFGFLPTILAAFVLAAIFIVGTWEISSLASKLTLTQGNSIMVIWALGIASYIFLLYCNKLITFWAISIAISYDISALVIGRLTGKNFLPKNISANKTYEGTLGGILVSTTIGTLFAHESLFPKAQIYQMILPVSAISAICAASGDLLCSWLKRHGGVKHSGELTGLLIPGHGGLIDRSFSIVLSIYPLALLAVLSTFYKVILK